MNPKLIELAERKGNLIARAESQRVELAQALAPWRGHLATLERGAKAIRSIKNHPELLAGFVVLAAVLRPWRLVRWLPRGWAVWRIARVALRAKKFLSGW
jgi:hypothetical protein